MQLWMVVVLVVVVVVVVDSNNSGRRIDYCTANRYTSYVFERF